MVSLLIASMILAGPAQAASQPSAPALTAGDLISKMFRRYVEAVTLVGAIQMTQEAQGHHVVTDTVLQYVRPNKMYLRQVEHSSAGKSFLLTSDGKTFSYDRPEDHYGQGRYVEPTRTQYKLLDISEMYTAGLASIVDPNPILNVAIGRTPDLKVFAGQLASYKIMGSSKVGDETVYQIGGKYAKDPNQAAIADYQMDVTEDGDFRRMIVRQAYGVPGHPEMAPITVTTTWISSLKVDGTPDKSLFTTVK